MSWFSKPDLQALLARERFLLDQIFGEGAYEVRSSHSNEASVHSPRLKLDLGYESRRDRSVSSALTVTEPWGEELNETHVWVRFLGEQMSPFPRNQSGHVTASLEDQLKAELKWVARLSAEIFSDPQKTRDAVNFVRGYTQAYNDSMSGAWDVAD